MKSMPSDGGDVQRLRNRIDRAVLLARCARMAGWLGRAGCIAVPVVIVASACDAFLQPRGFPAGRFVAAGATALWLVIAWWRWSGARPTRLDAALAAEAAHPELGERISRAVGFLEEPDEPADHGMGRGLRGLAVTQAATAAARIGRMPTPGLLAHAPWMAAGIASVGSLVGAAMLLPSPWGEAVRRQMFMEPRAAAHDHGLGGDARWPVGVESVEAPGGDGLPRPVTIAAAELAAAAAVESRLAAVLAARFALLPGRAAESLSGEQRQELAALAAVHRETVAAIRTARDTLAGVGEPSPSIRESQGLLEGIPAVTNDMTDVEIVANRLAMAAEGAARTAQLAAAAAAALGVHAGSGTADVASVAASRAASLNRAEATLVTIERRLPGDAAGAAIAQGREGVPREERGVPGVGERAGPAGGGVTSEPRFAAGDAVAERPADGADAQAARIERVWRLLSGPSRLSPIHGRAADVPIEYAPAVNLYYQMLLESLAGERSPGGVRDGAVRREEP